MNFLNSYNNRKKFLLFFSIIIIFIGSLFIWYIISRKFTAFQTPFLLKGTYYSILPPLMALLLAILTKNILFSLILAVFTGGFFINLLIGDHSLSFMFLGFLKGPAYFFESLFQYENLLILAFIVLILSTTTVMIVSGGIQGVIEKISHFANGARSTRLLTFILGILIFIDDYVNTIIVGSSVQPLTDKFKISREKLAFIVDSTSAPIAGLAFVSTWIGYEAGLFNKMAGNLSINSNGYSMFLDALPFRFYCIIMILFVFINSYLGIDFGPMKKAEEKIEKRNSNILSEEGVVSEISSSPGQINPQAKVNPLSAYLPIFVLLSFLFSGFWIDGNGMVFLRENFFNIFNPYIWRDVIVLSKNNKEIFLISAIFSFTTASLCARFFSGLNWKDIYKGIGKGIHSAFFPAMILILAWSLKKEMDILGAGHFLTIFLGKSVSPQWFPAIIFLAAGIISFVTGTSYGTMGILIPLAVPIAFHLDNSSYGITTIMSMGAVLDGAIFGDHCSPISDTTIMSSLGAGCDHISHVRTQLPYSLFVAFLAVGFGYLASGYGFNSWLGIGLASLVIVGTFLLIGKGKKGFV